MIVCSCNVLTDAKIRDSVNSEACARTPGAVYRCLGCSPNCGRCMVMVKRIIHQALQQRDASICDLGMAAHAMDQIAPAG